MAIERIVPRDARSASLFGGQIPNIRPVGASIQPSQFQAPPQVETTPPAKTNELLQVSEALSDLNPQLKAFGTSFIRNEALEASLSEEIAKEDANILTINQARELGKKDIQTAISEGIVKPEQTPQYYTALQKLAGQRTAKSDFYNFVLNQKDQTSGKLKYADRLNDPMNTQDPYEIMEEASNEFLQGSNNSSQIFNSSARREILSINQTIAEQAVKIRWGGRQQKMEELLSQEGQDILFDTDLNEEDKQTQVQSWLTRVYNSNVPNVANNFADKSLQPYILRLAKVNPDKARVELQKYENIPTKTGAKLGAGSNFEVFQSLYSQIDQLDEKYENQNSVDRQERINAISDQAQAIVYNYKDTLEDPSDLLNPDIQRKMVEELSKDIPLPNGQVFNLQDNPALSGKARFLLAEATEDIVKNEYREDTESLNALRVFLSKGDIQSAEGIARSLDDQRGWGRTGINSRSSNMIELQKLKDGAGIEKNPYVVDSTNKIGQSVSNFVFTNLANSQKGSEIASQTLIATASNSVINQKIVDKLKVVVEEARKENPNVSDSEIIQNNIQTVSGEVSKEVFKEAKEKFEKLDSGVQKSAQQEETLKSEEVQLPNGLFGELFKERETYNGQSFESPSVIGNRYKSNAKRRLQLRGAGVNENVAGLTSIDKRSILAIKEQEEKIQQQVSKILPLLAKDILEGKYDQVDGGRLMQESGMRFSAIKYTDEQMKKKQDQYWDLKSISGYSPNEIASGRTDEGLAIPFTGPSPTSQSSADSTSPIGERIRVFTTHFKSKEQLDQLMQDYKSGNKENDLGRIFKRFNLNGDDEEDSYVQQQVYLLGIYR